MKVKSEQTGARLTVYLEGELDHHAARKAAAEIADAVDSALPRELVLNLEGLTFMDSSGIAVILKSQRSMREIDGTIQVRGIRGQPLKVYEASGIARIIENRVRQEVEV